MKKEIKNHIKNFDLDYLNLVEKKIYKKLNKNKVESLLELMKNNDLSDGLQDLKELLIEYDKNILN